MKSRGKGEESGFVLLLVLLMASAIAITLYRAMPREAFERQRDREQLLIDRGEQYKRAIQLYVRKFKQYPTELKALEETNSIHFLRHRYKDPMTHKDEWRLVHAGPGGTFPDSKTMRPKSDKDKDKPTENTFITAGPTMSGPAAQAGGATPAYMVERGGQASMPGMQPGGGSAYPGAAGVPNYPAQPGMPGMVSSGQMVQNPTTAVPGQNPYQQPYIPGQQPGMPAGVAQPYPGQPGMVVPPGVPYPGQPYPVPGGIPGVPSNYPAGAANSQQGGAIYPYSTVPGQGGAPTTFGPGAQQPGAAAFPGGANPTNPGSTNSNAAINMIQQLLTTARPGGLQGTTDPQLSGLSGGIAGIASKAEMKSIKMYKDHEEYDEWEFIYNPREDAGPGRTMPKTGMQTGTGAQDPTGKQGLSSGGGSQQTQSPVH